ncbi:unnamed protein product [Anisakis simplex]|uniref:SWIRM-assoc_2 domain-containing protein n=1 Tax=Anisakis simplex TaxID=6269 RepID=A0A0M3JAV7_ANISI|nr:unnamed protein product [Anisakis simplex]
MAVWRVYLFDWTMHLLDDEKWPGYDDGDPDVEQLLNEQGIKRLRTCLILPDLPPPAVQAPPPDDNPQNDPTNDISFASTNQPPQNQQQQQQQTAKFLNLKQHESESPSNIASPAPSAISSPAPPPSSMADAPQSSVSNMAPSTSHDAKPKKKRTKTGA